MKVNLKQRREDEWRKSVRGQLLPLLFVFDPKTDYYKVSYEQLLTACRDAIDAELDEVSTGEGKAS